ncbi:MAG: phosphohydrolase [Candidatus Omnitrophota bacterium]
MLIDKCPGQDKRNIKIEILNCHSCGYLVEIFSDEIKVKCPSCGIWSARERLPNCLNWCASARQCLGGKSF